MSITVTRKATNSVNGQIAGEFWGEGTVPGVNPYVTGGLDCDVATDFGMASEPTMVTAVEPTGVYTAEWIASTKKLMVFVRATGAEAGAIDLSTIVFHIRVYGAME